MALRTVFRRASSTVATLSFRAARSPVSAFSTERLILGSQISRGSVISFSRFSTNAIPKKKADENLVKVIESEIECAMEEENPDQNVLEGKPEGFPFEIIDTPGERTVLLQRQFEDETIQVEVDTTAVDDEEEGEDGNGDQNGEDQDISGKIRIPMVVSVGKKDGVCLEFGVSAYQDEIVIDSLMIKRPEGSSENELAYEGPDFVDLDENLQKAFYRFLEIRGIKPSYTNFLSEYGENKDSREYVQWLKDLKSFVEK